MRRRLTMLMLTVALAAPLAASAQEVPLVGTVAEVFGRQAVVTTPEGRVLVTLPEGTAVPGIGARVELTGSRTGDIFAATAVRPATQAATPATTTAAPKGAAEMPAALAGLGLADVMTRTEEGRRGAETHFHGRLPEGGWLRAETREGRLVAVETDGVAMPPALIEAILPKAVRAEPSFARMARVTGIEIGRGGEIEVEGITADDQRAQLDFDPTGALREAEFDRANGRHPVMQSAVRQRLEGLGYTEVGHVKRAGRHVDAVARNPYGEWVEVRIGRGGRVERERMWDREED